LSPEEKTHLAPKPKSPDLQHHEHNIRQNRNKNSMNHCSRQWNASTINTLQLQSVSEPQQCKEIKLFLALQVFSTITNPSCYLIPFFLWWCYLLHIAM
jgi:hypothetical protein